MSASDLSRPTPQAQSAPPPEPPAPPLSERPEALVGGAFAAGVLTAMILKRLG